MRNVL